MSRAKSRSSRRLRLLRVLGLSLLAFICLTVALVLPWRWAAPPTTAFMARESRLRDEPVAHRWVDWEGISPNLAVAMIASEDQKFFQHNGFDWASIQSALEESRQGGRFRGASTISQQVAKNLYLWPEQSWIRKGAEAYLTAWIELLWPKRRILEVYLNVAEFGAGVFGVGAAADRLIGKPPWSSLPTTQPSWRLSCRVQDGCPRRVPRSM